VKQGQPKVFSIPKESTFAKKFAPVQKQEARRNQFDNANLKILKKKSSSSNSGGSVKEETKELVLQYHQQQNIIEASEERGKRRGAQNDISSLQLQANPNHRRDPEKN